MSVINVAIRKKEGNKKPTRYYSSKQEKHVAKELRGRQQPNSGATLFNKGDVITEDNWLIECKTCTKDKESFSIKKEWLEKNLKESMIVGKKYNALAFNFGPNGEIYYIIDETTFKELINNE